MKNDSIFFFKCYQTNQLVKFLNCEEQIYLFQTISFKIFFI